MRSSCIALLFIACRQTPEVRAHPFDLAPEELRPAAVTADRAAIRLQERLAARLMAEMARAGPSAAVHVCRDEAQPLTRAVGGELGLAIGRTSHRLRNPKNVPPPWAAAFVAASADRKLDEVRAVVFDLGDRVGLLKPIGVQGVCLSCHGAPGAIDPEVVERLRADYPEDRATGFALGDLRGFIWVEAPKSVTSSITASSS
jgi:hypothetical protein